MKTSFTVRSPDRLLVAALLLALSLSRTICADEESKVETEVPVQVGKIRRATLRSVVIAYGLIEPQLADGTNPPASARLAPAISGIISEVNGSEGQHVEKGAILFRLDSRAVDAAVSKAQLSIEFAEKNSDRQKKLIGANGTSEKLLLEAEQTLASAQAELAAAKVQQSLLRGEAPLSGTITRITARPGEVADMTTPLVEIVDLDRLAANVRVPRSDAAELRVGQKAELIGQKGHAPVDCVISNVSLQVDSATDTILVRISVAKGSEFQPGQFVTARMFSAEHKDCLAVPVSSIVTDGNGKPTIALLAGNLAKQQVVKTGFRESGLIEIEGDGVREGQTVVTMGAYGLPSETKVRVVDSETR